MRKAAIVYRSLRLDGKAYVVAHVPREKAARLIAYEADSAGYRSGVKLPGLPGLWFQMGTRSLPPGSHYEQVCFQNREAARAHRIIEAVYPLVRHRWQKELDGYSDQWNVPLPVEDE